MRSHIAATSAAVALLAPATALAQAPTTQTTPPPPPPPPPAPAAGKLSISLSGIADRGEVYVLKGSKAHVSGTLSPFVAGQKVRIALYRGRKKVGDRTVDVKQKGGDGVFSTDFRMRSSGNFDVKAAHDATPQQARAVAKVRRLGAISAGHGGEAVRLLQLGMHRLGYATPVSGRLDQGTRLALLAFRKVNKMARTTSPSKSIYQKVFAGKGTYHLRYPKAGKHVEANLERQVVVLADHGRPEHIYHMSSGKPSTPTVRGEFHFYSKTPGFNSEQMYDSNYFIGGYAIHGYPSVPNYAASHGCIRVPNMDAPAIFAWISLGDPIWVY